ncbi:MAG: YccJ family protein, partial [bacterium]
MKHFPDLTDELHTDKEILAAIYKLANKDETEARKIWDSPTHDELCQIIHWVTVKG